MKKDESHAGRSSFSIPAVVAVYYFPPSIEFTTFSKSAVWIGLGM